MSEMRVKVHRLSKVICCLLAVFVLGWGFTDYKALFLGLVLGTCVSFVNALYTAVKVRQFGQRLLAGLKPKGLGMLTRFSMVALAVLVAIRFPELINIPSLAVGLVLAPVVLFIDGLADHYRIRNTRVERGGE